MQTHKQHKPSCKVWIEYKGKPLIGKGGAEILETIQKENSISKAAKNLGMSYRYVWNYIQEIQKTLKQPIVQTYKGGKSGGGGANLTELGKDLLEEYKQVESYLNKILLTQQGLEVEATKLSARNQLKGKVLSVEKGVITAKVKMQIEAPAVVTAVITKEAVEDLGLKEGDTVQAIVKSTEIIIGK